MNIKFKNNFILDILFKLKNHNIKKCELRNKSILFSDLPELNVNLDAQNANKFLVINQSN